MRFQPRDVPQRHRPLAHVPQLLIDFQFFLVQGQRPRHVATLRFQPRDVPQRHRHPPLRRLPLLLRGRLFQQLSGRGQAGLQQFPRPAHLAVEDVVIG